MRYYTSLIAVAVIGISIFTACQKPAPPTNKTKTSTNSFDTPPSQDPSATAPRISLAEAKQAFDEGNAVFVDTRAEVQYRQEHVRGAINVPAEAMEMRYKEIPTDKKIIAYCS